MQHMHRSKEKIMAYLLFTEFGYTKTAIATLMKISPQQMGVWIREAKYEIQLYQMGGELATLRAQLQSLGYQPVQPLNAATLQGLL
ncbi:hypothetical protein HWD96_11575 [Pseudomonas putida]|nr:hypothetical protein [Pseudomonas putida]